MQKHSKQLKQLINRIDEMQSGVKNSLEGSKFLNFLWGKYIKLHHTEKQALNFEQICKLTLNQYLKP